MAPLFKNFKHNSRREVQSFAIGEEKVVFNSRGLIPAVLQARIRDELRVVDLIYFNKEALQLSLNSGVLFVYRRSKRSVERLGEKTGNTYKIKSIQVSLNHRSLLITILDDHGELPALSFTKTVYSV